MQHKPAPIHAVTAQPAPMQPLMSPTNAIHAMGVVMIVVIIVATFFAMVRK